MLGGQAVEVVLDFVVAPMELDRLTALAAEAGSDLQVFEGWAEFGAGVALDATEPVDSLLMLGFGLVVGIGIAALVGAERTA